MREGEPGHEAMFWLEKALEDAKSIARLAPALCRELAMDLVARLTAARTNLVWAATDIDEELWRLRRDLRQVRDRESLWHEMAEARIDLWQAQGLLREMLPHIGSTWCPELCGECASTSDIRMRVESFLKGEVS